ncbi:MAG: GTP-binding protein [Candidatus Aenigmarchaeota archaeon]|nr:GTP-binding protein [Candidatus Aenigmarchaeota archaeon]
MGRFSFAAFFRRLSSIFRSRGEVKIGLYGPVNSGKTTLANKICLDWMGEEMGKASVIPHETRTIQMKEKVTIKARNKSLKFNLVDTPGIATRIDYEDFLKHGLSRKAAKQRAREATKGIIEAIKWLDDMDMVLVVVDATKDPLTQVNLTILGNLDARGIPFLIVANKMDLGDHHVRKVQDAFHSYKTVGVSALAGSNMDHLYQAVVEAL